MKKRLLSILLVVCMMITMVPAVSFAAEYGDTDGHWAESSIDRWSDYGVVEGMDGLFLPDGDLTRAQMAAILTRLLNLPAATDAGFSDVDASEWYATYINSCAKAGIMLGSNGQARPNDTISRQESMVMIARALGIQPAANPDLSGYADSSSVADWAAPYVAAMTEKGIVNGTTDTTVGGTDEINRGSMVTILDRAITTVVTEPGATVEADGAGIIIVAAPNVTITGDATGVVVTPESGGNVTLDNATVEEAVVVMSPETTVTVGENSTVGVVSVTENAESAKVEVSETAKVDTVQTEAPSTELKVDGTVTDVAVGETATETKVDTGKNSTITNVENKAENTTVTGSGKVENVTTSGNNTTVETGGTKVEAAEGTTGTTAGNKDVAAGESTTTEQKPATPAPSAPSHSHNYATEVVAEDGTVTLKCSCGSTTPSEKIYVAQAGEKYFETLAEAVADDSSVKLLRNVTLEKGIDISKKVTLDLNGKTLSAASNMPSTALIKVVSGGDLEITGNGTVNSASNGNDYNIAVWASNGKVVIKNGTFTNDGGQAVELNNSSVPNNNELIYASGTGEIEIQDGMFTGNTKNEKWHTRYTLNIKDADYTSGTAKIIVKGGTFTEYDPANSDGENPAANLVAVGYSSVKDGNNYVVSEGIKNEASLRAAIASEATTVKLVDDIVLSKGITISKSMTLDLNGKKLSADKEKMSSTALIAVTGNNTLVITGDGTVDSASQGNDYNIAVWAIGEAKVTIENGTFTNLDGKDFESEKVDGNYPANNNELIYASGGGTIDIEDGTFIGNYNNKTYQARYTLNIQDKSGSTINVTGGRFCKYDPSFSKSENPIANFVAVGYSCLKEGEEYVVSKGVKTEAELRTALSKDGTVALAADIQLATNSIGIAGKDVVLDLNGCTLSVSDKFESNNVIWTSGKLTVIDSSEAQKGTINAAADEICVIALWSYGGNITIEGGTFTNDGYKGNEEHCDLIYASDTGTITVNGGTFKAKTPKWTLNNLDGNNGIVVKGGTFYGVNPSKVYTEPTQPLNFVADGYTVTEENNIFTVTKVELQ